MQKSEFKFDKEAAELFAAIGGIDTRRRIGLSPRGRGQIEKRLLARQHQFDRIRNKLSQLMFYTGRYISGGGPQPVDAGDKAVFNDLGTICRELHASSLGGRTVLIRSRGLSAVTREAGSSGYEIIFGDVLLDSDVAAASVKRQGDKACPLRKQLEHSFKLFDKCGISSLFLRLPEDGKQLGAIIQALQVVAQYLEAVRNDGAITLVKGGRRLAFRPTVDEDDAPDPNLTLLTIFNGLKPEYVTGLIQKVDALLRRQKKQATYDQHLNVYNAIFRIKKLRGRLRRPPSKSTT